MNSFFKNVSRTNFDYLLMYIINLHLFFPCLFFKPSYKQNFEIKSFSFFLSIIQIFIAKQNAIVQKIPSPIPLYLSPRAFDSNQRHLLFIDQAKRDRYAFHVSSDPPLVGKLPITFASSRHNGVIVLGVLSRSKGGQHQICNRDRVEQSRTSRPPFLSFSLFLVFHRIEK